MLTLVGTTIVHTSRCGPVTIELTERQRDNFLAKVGAPDAGGGCWCWTGSRDRHGYGNISVNGFCIGAHRVAYQLAVGAVPDGMDLDHLCRIRHCVNPAHLEPVSRRENTMRSSIAPAGVNAAKASCINGHAYVAANTYLDRAGHRHCRTCRAAARERHAARGAGALALPRVVATGSRAEYRKRWYRERANASTSAV